MRFFTLQLSLWWILALLLLTGGLLLICGSGLKCGRSGTAITHIEGGPLAPQLSGTVNFIPVPGGTEVVVEVVGLPPYQPAASTIPPVGPHGFHVHENGDCTVGNPANPFQAAGGHYNPDDQPHGNHAGDLPVLFSNDGVAKMTVFTRKFSPSDVVGRSVIIHMNPDDYRSQPSGDAGPRLACGVIRTGD